MWEVYKNKDFYWLFIWIFGKKVLSPGRLFSSRGKDKQKTDFEETIASLTDGATYDLCDCLKKSAAVGMELHQILGYI